MLQICFNIFQFVVQLWQGVQYDLACGGCASGWSSLMHGLHGGCCQGISVGLIPFFVVAGVRALGGAPCATHQWRRKGRRSLAKAH